MKTGFGLLLLSGVLALQVSGRYHHCQVPCKLSVNNFIGSPIMSSIKEMKSCALKVLILFLADQNLGIDSVVCVTEQLVDGTLYEVQYNGLYWVQIYSPLFGKAQITDKGVITEPTEQPF